VFLNSSEVCFFDFWEVLGGKKQYEYWYDENGLVRSLFLSRAKNCFELKKVYKFCKFLDKLIKKEGMEKFCQKYFINTGIYDKIGSLNENFSKIEENERKRLQIEYTKSCIEVLEIILKKKNLMKQKNKKYLI